MRSRIYSDNVGRPHAFAALALVGCASGSDVNSSASSFTVGTGSDTGSSSTASVEATTDITTATTSDGSSSSGADVTSGDETSCENVSWYLDADGDGRGDPLLAMSACDPPPDHVAFGDDCDDTDPAISPAANEVCDAIDNDCDTLVDEFSAMNTSCNGCTLAAAEGHSYALCPDIRSWDDARTSCAAIGGDLLVLEADAEQAAIIAIVEPVPAGPGGWFFAINDRTTEGTFLWPDGSVPTFTAWGVGEPNDAGGNEDCGELDLAAGTWNDIPCTDLRAFICEAAPPR